MNDVPEAEVQVAIPASSKKQRSARSSGKKGWNPAVSEVRWLVGSNSTPRDLSPLTRVWAKREGGPWWPAQVARDEDISHDEIKQDESRTHVRFYGPVHPTSAWLKNEDLASFEKHLTEFSHQSLPDGYSLIDFNAALAELQNIAGGNTGSQKTPKSSSTFPKLNGGKPQSFPPSCEVLKGTVISDTVEKALKKRKTKSKGVEREPTSAKLREKGKGALKEGKERNLEAARAGKRVRKQLVDRISDGTLRDRSVLSPTKKTGVHQIGNSTSLGSRDNALKSSSTSSKGKKTGADGYYFECFVCDVGGELLCCDLCPRVYHMECLVPRLKRTPPGKWLCPFCRVLEQSKVVVAKMQESKMRQKLSKERDTLTSVSIQKLRGAKRNFKTVQKADKIMSDMDLKTMQKRRDVGSERPVKKLKGSRPMNEDANNCSRCCVSLVLTGAPLESSLCKDCADLDKQGQCSNLSVEILAGSQQSKQTSRKCVKCGLDESVVGCDMSKKDFHNDCELPPLKRTPKVPWSCPSCRPKHEDHHLGNSISTSLEVDRILGCRIVPFSAARSPQDQSIFIDCSRAGRDRETVKPSLAGTSVGITEKNMAKRPALLGLSIMEQEADTSSIVHLHSSALTTLEMSGITSAGAEVPVLLEENSRQLLNEAHVMVEDYSILEYLAGNRDNNVSEGSSLSQKTLKSIEFGDTKDIDLSNVSRCTNEVNHSEAATAPIYATDNSSGDHSLSRKGNGPSSAPVGEDRAPLLNRTKVSNSEYMGDMIVAASGCKNEDSSASPLAQHSRSMENCKAVKSGSHSSNAVVVVEEHFPSLGSNEDPVKFDYLVKWAGRAHIHNKWISESQLRDLAKRKLDDFLAKYGHLPVIVVHDEWLKPQRIIARQYIPGKQNEVLVKWSGLPYDECTWEKLDEPVIAQNMHLLDAYDRFEHEVCSAASSTNDSTECNSYKQGLRPSEIETIKEQPSFLRGGFLYPHQIDALDWLRNCWHQHKNVILADEMGLGKTISACSFISALHHEFNVCRPCLILVPLSTMPDWLAEFSVWDPSLNVIEYHGSSKARTTIRQYEWHANSGDGPGKKTQSFKFNVMLTTYETVILDASFLRPIPWEVLIVDEGQRLKNSSCKLFGLLNMFWFSHKVLLTSSPLQNNFGEMFNLLNFLQPDLFPSLAAFNDKFSTLSTTEQVEKMKKLVAPHMLRRLKKDVMQNIPPKSERLVSVDMNSLECELYRAILAKNYQLLSSGGKQQSMLNILMQLRKVCNHPYLLCGPDPGSGTPEYVHEMQIQASAKLTLLHSMLCKLKEQGHRVLIFSQMTKLLDVLEDYLTYQYGHGSFERVDGSVSVATRQAAVSRFNQDTSCFVFLMSTRSCGLGINLATADTVIIYDSDFNPQADFQAMNRAHRIGQSKRLVVYRFFVRASVEERILQLAKKKLLLDHLFANKSGSQKEVQDILRWGTEDLFQENSTLVDVPAQVGSPAAVSIGMEECVARLRSKTGGSGGIIENKHMSGRAKIVWDDSAIARLLDRSDLTMSLPEGSEECQETDVLGAFKVWNWNDQELTEEPETTDDMPGSGINVSATKLVGAEDVNKWDKLLQSRWETMEIDNSEVLGQGKRQCKAVAYVEATGCKSKEAEASSESSIAGEEEDLEPDYTPEGQALKQKLTRLRARQKNRISQRFNAGLDDGEIGSERKSDNKAVLPAAESLWSHEHTEGRTLYRAMLSNFIKSSCFGNLTLKILNQPTPVPATDSCRNDYPYPRSSTSFGVPSTTLCNGGGSSSRGSVQDLPQALWFGAASSASGGLAVIPPQVLTDNGRGMADENRVEGGSAITLPVVSHEQQRAGQNLNQLLPALRQSLQGAQFGTFSQHGPTQVQPSAPVEPVLGVFTTLRAGNHFTKDFVHDNQTSVSGPTHSSGPPDTGFGFLSRTASASVAAGEKAADHPHTQNSVQLSQPLGVDRNLPVKVQVSDGSPGLSTITRQHESQVLGSPNLSITLGLGGSKEYTQHTAINTSVENQVALKGVLPSQLTLVSGASTGADLRDIEMAPFSSPFDKMDRTEMGPRDLVDKVNSQRSVAEHCADDHTKANDTQRWTEDELDHLWLGVRRYGQNWVIMMQDPKFHFGRSRTAQDLADCWREEELKTARKSLQYVKNAPTSLEVGARICGNLEPAKQQNQEGDHERQANAIVFSVLNNNCESSSALPSWQHIPFLERKDSIHWPTANLDAQPGKDKLSHMRSLPNISNSSTAGLQLVDKIGELSRPETGKQGTSYHSLLGFASGQPSTSSAGGILPELSYPKYRGSLENNSSELQNDHPESMAASKFGVDMWPSFNSSLVSNLRTADFKSTDAGSHHQQSQLPSFDNLRPPTTGFLDRNNVLRSQVLHYSPVPGANPLLYLRGGQATSSRPVAQQHQRGQSSFSDQRRKPRLSSSMKQSSVNNTAEVQSSLPHWLREAVKARAPPFQPPLPPAIAAVVQATSLLYKDSNRLLPPLVHPGYPLLPPKESPKKYGRKKRHRPKLSHPQEMVEGVNHSVGLDLSRSIKVEAFNQQPNSISDGPSSVGPRLLSTSGQVPGVGLWSQGMPEHSLGSLFDNTQQLLSSIPASSISELMAKKNLFDLGFLPGFRDTVFNGSNKGIIADEPSQLSTIGSAQHGHLDPRTAELDPAWKRGDVPSMPSLSRQYSANITGGLLSSETLARMGGRICDASTQDAQKSAPGPCWLMAASRKGDSKQKQRHHSKAELAPEDSDSKTESDPGIVSKRAANVNDCNDASSEETVSDDRTQ